MKRNIFVASAFAAMAAPAAAQTPALPVIHLSGSGTADIVPYLYAVKNGSFKAAGFDTDFLRSNNGSATVAAAVGGSIDIGKASTGSLISARARNIDIKIHVDGALFRASDTRGTVMLVVATDSGLRTAKDLSGKTIAIPALGDQNTLALRSWVDSQGGDSKSIQLIEIPANAAAAAVVQKRVAAAVIVPPYTAKAASDGSIHVLAAPFAAIAPRFLETAWFTTADYAAKHRDMLARFAKIMGEAAAYANAHFAETAGMLATFTSTPTQTIVDNGISAMATSVDVRDIQPLIDAMAKYGLIQKGFDANDFLLK